MTEVEEKIFGGYCWVDCMHKQGCENEGTPTMS